MGRHHCFRARVAASQQVKSKLQSDYVSTTEVASALGVGVSTVKRWVEEGILPAQKTAGGHRKLLLTDVLELARQSNLPVRGVSPANNRKRGATRPAAQVEPVRLYGALFDGDVRQTRQIVHGAYASGLSVESIGDSLIAPAMARIGSDWESGRIDVLHEHRATQLCLGVLHELRAVLENRARRDRPVAVGGALEGDFSEIPTLLAQMVLLDASWDAINLGPNTPVSSLIRGVAELKPRLVWLSISHAEKRVIESLPDLYRTAEKSGVPVIVGGQALTEQLRSSIPYTIYGDGFTQLAAFARSLQPRPRRPKRGRPSQD